MADANCPTFGFDEDIFDITDDEICEYITQASQGGTEQTTTETSNANDKNNTNILNVNENAKLDDDEVTRFISDNRNTNTTKKTRSDLNTFYQWSKSVNENRKLDAIPPNELHNIISHFILKIRKKDGTEFEPDTLTFFVRS